jgi:hypothetical protein
MMLLRIPAFAVIVLTGFCIQAHAQSPCLEFPRLQRESALPPRGCDSYNRLSIAWREVLRYATDNRESCGISVQSLKEFEKHYEQMIKARDNVCAGQPPRGFPADRFRR